MKRIVVNTDLLTSILGFVTSGIILIKQIGWIDEDIFALLSGMIALTFGYFTNKIRIKKDISKKVLTETKTTELES
jgi:hypothetical protein